MRGEPIGTFCLVLHSHLPWLQSALALASDWTFMVTEDSAADDARRRVAEHRDPFGDLDARGLRTPARTLVGARS